MECSHNSTTNRAGMKKHIYFTGFMGAGKSRVGRTLAAHWNWPYFDTDKVIEEETGLSVMDIFDQQGEAAFRAMETQTIRRLSAEAYPSIISLGGGATMTPENLKIIQETGLVIYIKSSPEYILQRVSHTNKRPLLKVDREQPFKEALLQKIVTLLKEREPTYAQADIVVERDGLEPEAIVTILEKKLKAKMEF